MIVGCGTGRCARGRVEPLRIGVLRVEPELSVWASFTQHLFSLAQSQHRILNNISTFLLNDS